MTADRDFLESEDEYFQALTAYIFARKGDPDGQYDLGAKYIKGKSVPKNPERAAYWWLKAAEQGHVQAEFGLGLLYESGNGVPQNLVEARKWFQLAHDHGEEMAYDKLLALDSKS